MPTMMTTCPTRAAVLCVHRALTAAPCASPCAPPCGSPCGSLVSIIKSLGAQLEENPIGEAPAAVSLADDLDMEEGCVLEDNPNDDSDGDDLCILEENPDGLAQKASAEIDSDEDDCVLEAN